MDVHLSLNIFCRNKLLRPTKTGIFILWSFSIDPENCFQKHHLKTSSSSRRKAQTCSQLDFILAQVPGPKKWLILGVSLTHLVESRDLFFLEAEVVDKIFSVGCTKKYAADKRLC